MWSDFLDNLPGTALDLFLRATILLVIAGLIVRTLQRASAAYRHVVWVLALAGVLIQPFLSRFPVPWSVDVPIPFSTSITPLPRPMAPPLSAPVVPHQLPTAAVPAAPHELLWSTLGVFLWLGGAVIVLVPLFLGIRRVRALYRHSVVPSEELGPVIENTLVSLPVSRPVSVRVASATHPVSVPMTWGWYRPSILLPAAAEGWTTEQVRATLLHELAHILRADWLVQMGLHLTCAFYWWHPLVWWAARQTREESERACDDFALNAGIASADYAAHLVAVVRALHSGTGTAGATIAMAQPGGMERRVRAALSETVNRQPLTRRHLTLGAGTAFLLALGFACLHPIITVAAPLAPRNTFTLYYLSRVACTADRNRPLEMGRIQTSSTGPEMYQVIDKRTRKTFRDGATITAEFAQLALKGKQPHAGASAFTVPAELSAFAPQATLYLTTAQRQQVDGLRTELQTWKAFLKASQPILSSADLKPNAVAVPSPSKNGYSVRITLTPSGSRKLLAFTKNHVAEVVGVVLDPDQPNSQLLMAPTINEPIASSTLEIDNFKRIDDAMRLAHHLNAR